MNFNKFFDENQEHLSRRSFAAAMREAWEDGYAIATRDMYQAVIDGLKGEHFREQSRERAETEKMKRLIAPDKAR